VEYQITTMTLDRYDELIAFWRSAEGLRISDDDDYDNLRRFLQRNPDLSLVVLHDNRIIGAIKCSQDGRRGYLHHLAVKNEFRNSVSAELVEKCVKNYKKRVSGKSESLCWTATRQGSDSGNIWDLMNRFMITGR